MPYFRAPFNTLLLTVFLTCFLSAPALRAQEPATQEWQQPSAAQAPGVTVSTDFNPRFFEPDAEGDTRQVHSDNGSGNTSITFKKKEAPALIPYQIDYMKGLLDACTQVLEAQRGNYFDLRGHGLCEGYVRGVKNTYDMQQRAGHKGTICFPANITWLDLIATFVNWAKEREGEHSKLAWTSVVNAFSDTYPCPPGPQ